MNLFYQVLIAPIETALRVAFSATYAVIGSYGLSILTLSLLVNLLLLPLYRLAKPWQEAERRAQQQLRPKLEQFKQSFSGEERHAMIQTLYRQAGYHPIYALRSSLGLFLQVPFWIAAYHLLSGYAPLQGASFLVLDDLGQPDRLLWGLNVLPFIMTGLNLGAAFVHTKNKSPLEQIQPIFLAILFLLLLYPSPAGLLLYWTFNSLLSLLRIALIESNQADGQPPGTPPISASQALPPSGAPSTQQISQPAESHSSRSSAGLTTIPRTANWQAPHALALPWLLSFALFLVAAAIQISLYCESFASAGGILDKSR